RDFHVTGVQTCALPISVFLINSRYPQFSAATPEEVKHTFSRSYGVNLPSSLTRFNSNALEYSSHSPESVYGTGNLGKHNEAFLRSEERRVGKEGRARCT